MVVTVRILIERHKFASIETLFNVAQREILAFATLFSLIKVAKFVVGQAIADSVQCLFEFILG